MKHELRRRCVRWLEKHWKQHEPEEHHLYLYDRNETVAVPEFHTGKVKLMDTVTKIIPMEEAPATIIDNEKNPGDYIKVIVKVAD